MQLPLCCCPQAAMGIKHNLMPCCKLLSQTPGESFSSNAALPQQGCGLHPSAARMQLQRERFPAARREQELGGERRAHLHHVLELNWNRSDQFSCACSLFYQSDSLISLVIRWKIKCWHLPQIFLLWNKLPPVSHLVWGWVGLGRGLGICETKCFCSL